MKKTLLPFQIGEQYENWEFDLEILEIDKIAGFDSYTYLNEIKFLGLVPQNTELIFSWDILQCVVFTFNFESMEQLNRFRRDLIQSFGESKSKENFEVYYISDNLVLWFVYNSLISIQVIYANKQILCELKM